MKYKLSNKEKDNSLAFVIGDTIKDVKSFKEETGAKRPELFERARVAYDEHMEGSVWVMTSKRAAEKDKAIAEFVLQEEELIWETIYDILDDLTATRH